MIVQCIRCGTEFISSPTRTHICPNCHFVFPQATPAQEPEQAEEERKDTGLDIIHSPLLAPAETAHRLLEESPVKCAFHPDTDALAYCRRCGRPLCYACAIEEDDKVICEPCEQERRPGGEEPQQAAGADREESLPEREKRETVSKALARGPYVAWEYRRQIGELNAFFKTFRQSLFSPLRFFQRVPIIGDYQSPLLYGLYWTMIGIGGGIFWRLILWGFPAVRSFMRGEGVPLSLHAGQNMLTVVFLLLISPLLGIGLLLAASVLYHIFVVLMTGSHGKFQSTLRVVCYSAGTNIFFFVPLLGVLIGGIWQLVLVTIGLREMHRVVFATAVTVALIPYTVLLVFCLAFMYWAVSGQDFGLIELLTRQMLRLF